MNCKKCDYEWCSLYLDDDGNEFVPSHYCNNNKFYDCDTEEWENDNLEEEKCALIKMPCCIKHKTS